MSTFLKPEAAAAQAEEPGYRTISSPVFDGEIAAKIGERLSLRRTLCGLSKHQLGARLGVSASEIEAYEQGKKRLSCALLLEAARHLKATPRFFFR
jgi:predicted transcriptional regulator